VNDNHFSALGVAPDLTLHTASNQPMAGQVQQPRGATVSTRQCVHLKSEGCVTMSDDRESEIQRLLEELDHVTEEQRRADGRDPDALVECERKLAEVRQRVARLSNPNGARSEPKCWAGGA